MSEPTMSWDKYLASQKEQITTVQFLTNYILKIDGNEFEFIKSAYYEMPVKYVRQLKKQGLIIWIALLFGVYRAE